jgi:hypothetical protein
MSEYGISDIVHEASDGRIGVEKSPQAAGYMAWFYILIRTHEKIT